MSIKTHTTKRGTVYEVRLRGPDGREVSRRFRTKADAANYEAAQMAARARGTWVDPTASSMTFARGDRGVDGVEPGQAGLVARP